MGNKRYNNERIMVISDLHLPYQKKGSLAFLEEVKLAFKPERVICTGDLVDSYSSSQYTKDANHKHTASAELELARKSIQKLATFLPALILTLGNHDIRYSRAATKAGLSSDHLLSFRKVFKLPRTWKVVRDEFALRVESCKQRIVFAHHLGANPALVAGRRGHSVITGHQHSKAGITAVTSGRGLPYYGVNVPSLISNTGCPFSYSKLANINPIIGCVLIEEGVPRMVLMGKKGEPVGLGY